MPTVIQPEDNSSAQEGSQSLSQGVHRQLDPGLTSQEAHSKGHGRVQVGPLGRGRWGLLVPACHSGKARYFPHAHSLFDSAEQRCREGFIAQNGGLDYVIDPLC